MYELLHFFDYNARDVWVSASAQVDVPTLTYQRVEPPATSPLAPHLLLDFDDERGIDHDFFGEMVARMPEDDSIEGAIVTACEELSRQLSRLTMNDNYKPYMAVSLPFALTGMR